MAVKTSNSRANAKKKGTVSAAVENKAVNAEAVKEETVKAETVKTEAVKAEAAAEKAVKEETVKAAKPETVKAIGTTKDATKKLETKAAVLVDTPAEKAEDTKDTEKKTEEKKAPAKKPGRKPAAKKAAEKKEEMKSEFILQYADIECSETEILKRIKENWTKVLKNKAGDMKDVKVYLKPEERKAYYVVNGNATGAVDL